MRYVRFLFYIAIVALSGAYILALFAHVLHCWLDGYWLKCPYRMMDAKGVLLRGLFLFFLMTFLLIISILGARKK
jgi:hypothetical protein